MGRPVRELLAERAAVSVRSGAAGLALAWLLGLAGVAALEWRPAPRRRCDCGGGDGRAVVRSGGVVALLCVYAGAAPAVAIAVILFPRIFRYARNVVGAGAPRAACAGGPRDGSAAVAASWRCMSRRRSLPDLLALAGVSVSMAVGATIPVEALCDSPGVGHLLWQAALSRDVPVLVNVTLLITALTAGANLLADTARAAREMRGVKSGGPRQSCCAASGALDAAGGGASRRIRTANSFGMLPNARASRQFPLGTDALGRDRLSRALYGGRLSLACAPAAALLSGLLAMALGFRRGLGGRRMERAVTLAADLCLSLPGSSRCWRRARRCR